MEEYTVSCTLYFVQSTAYMVQCTLYKKCLILFRFPKQCLVQSATLHA